MDIGSLPVITLASVLAANSPMQGEVSSAKISTHILPPIAGQWEIQLPENAQNQATACQELYHFGKDNEVMTTSGAEWTYGSYIYTQMPDSLPILAINTLHDNNAVDCSGKQINQTGDSMIAFVNYQDNVMFWCSDANGKQCDMQFRRVLP